MIKALPSPHGVILAKAGIHLPDYPLALFGQNMRELRRQVLDSRFRGNDA